jgi:hypothetical protein
LASQESVRLALGSPDLTAIRSLAVKQINHVQGTRPADQLNATALALVAMSEACGADPYEVVSIAKRVMKHAEGPFTHQVQAIRDYAAAEIGRL